MFDKRLDNYSKVAPWRLVCDKRISAPTARGGFIGMVVGKLRLNPVVSDKREPAITPLKLKKHQGLLSVHHFTQPHSLISPSNLESGRVQRDRLLFPTYPLKKTERDDG